MTLSIGDRLPSLSLHTYDEGPKPITTDAVFGGKTVVLFAVPGAFTPTCSARHLPGFVEQRAAFAAKGVDTVACIAVNDAFVLNAWAKDQNSGEAVLMLADGNGAFARATGLVMDGTGFGMGERLQRFALVAKDGVVTHLFVEAPGEFKVSAADHVLANI